MTRSVTDTGRQPDPPPPPGAPVPTLDRQDDVFVLDLGDDENRVHPD